MRATAAAALLAFAGTAAALPPDLKVSTDDLNEAGEHFIEIQANKASRAGPDAEDTRVPFQFLAEYSYGITDHWQVALKLPFAREAGIRSLGATAELRYLGAHDRAAGAYWGMNVSAARGRDQVDEPHDSSVELQPVLGYRIAGWHLAANPTLAKPVSGEDRRTTFFLQAKAGRAVGGHELGLEYFLDAGPFRDWTPRRERKEYLFLVWDKVVGNELNFGIGRGLTDASERWILKVIYSFPLK
jgi:hypothetical protein